MLFPEDPNGGGGWKVDWKNLSFCESEKKTMNNLIDMEGCLKKYTYIFNETVLNCSLPYERTIQVFITSGLVHMLRPLNNSLKATKRPMYLSLNPKLNYFVGFVDQKFILLSSNPSTAPYILNKIESNSGTHIFHLKVSKSYIFELGKI